jgi:uncharacterized protein
MKRERLEELSFETLVRVASQYDIEVDPSLSRLELIEQVVEAIVESQTEREASDNDQTKIERHKYRIIDSEELYYDPDDTYVLPKSYNKTRVVLMLRDPAWAFAYWELAEALVQLLESRVQFDGLVLRVDQLDSLEAVVDSFDIPVQLSDLQWYIHLPERNTRYRASLVSRVDGEEETHATSGTIMVPPGTVVEADEETNTDRSDRVLAYSGLDRLGVSTFGKRIPQRIISLIDEKLLGA